MKKLIFLVFFPVLVFAYDYSKGTKIGETRSLDNGHIFQIESSNLLSLPCPPQTDTNRDAADVVNTPLEGSCYHSTDKGYPHFFNGTVWDNFNYWKGQWVPGVYNRGEEVRDGDWTCIAKTKTTERCAPTAPDGSTPNFLIPEVPGFTELFNTGSTIYSGLEMTTNELLRIDEIRAWIPENSVNHDYDLVLINATDENNPTIIYNQQIPNSFIAPGWFTVLIPSVFIVKDSKIRLILSSTKFTSATAWDHDWNLSGSGTGDPGPNNYYRNNSLQKLYVNKMDFTGVERQTDLSKLKEGDELTLVETSQVTRYNKYEVTNSVDQGTYFEIDYILIESGSAIRSGRRVTWNANVNEGVLDSPYSQLTNYWQDNDPFGTDIYGFLADNFNATPTYSENAKGLDLKALYLDVSEEWDVKAVNAIGGGSPAGGGGSGNVVGPDVFTDSGIALFDDLGTLLKSTDYNIPTADGLENQVLQTDGLGNVNWATIEIPEQGSSIKKYATDTAYQEDDLIVVNDRYTFRASTDFTSSNIDWTFDYINNNLADLSSLAVTTCAGIGGIMTWDGDNIKISAGQGIIVTQDPLNPFPKNQRVQ